MLEFLSSFIQGTLECTGMIAISTVICQLPHRWKQSFLVGMIMSLTIYIIKTADIFYGLHTLFGLFLPFLYLIVFRKAPLLKGLIALLVCISFVAVIELLSLKVYPLLHLNVEQIAADPISWAIAGLPQGFLFIIAALILSRFIKPVTSEV